MNKNVTTTTKTVCKCFQYIVYCIDLFCDISDVNC